MQLEQASNISSVLLIRALNHRSSRNVNFDSMVHLVTWAKLEGLLLQMRLYLQT